MKKIILTLTLITFVALAKAQVHKGTMYVGGGFSYNSYKIGADNVVYVSTKNRQLNIMPTIGTFLSSHWAIGLTPTYSYTEYTYASSSPFYVGSNTKSKMIGGSIELRYYLNITDKFAFYSTLSGNYLTDVDNSYYDNNHLYGAALTPSFVYFATPKLAINLGFGGLQYTRQTQKTKGDNSSSTSNIFNAGVNYNTNVGVGYYF